MESAVLHVALTSTSPKVTQDELQAVAAALSKQVERDFAPLWAIQATVSAFSNPANITPNYWPVTVQDTLDEPDAAGYHSDEHNQPYSLILYGPDWSVTASHEVLEMIGDPWGNRLVTGKINGHHARILREMCDPCEDQTYEVDGVKVSDFLLPAYYGTNIKDKHYSFLNSLPGPLTINKGGYVSYIIGDRWEQESWFGSKPIVEDLGPVHARPSHMSLRSYIDSIVRKKRK